MSTPEHSAANQTCFPVEEDIARLHGLSPEAQRQAIERVKGLLADVYRRALATATDTAASSAVSAGAADVAASQRALDSSAEPAADGSQAARAVLSRQPDQGVRAAPIQDNQSSQVPEAATYAEQRPSAGRALPLPEPRAVGRHSAEQEVFAAGDIEAASTVPGRVGGRELSVSEAIEVDPGDTQELTAFRSPLDESGRAPRLALGQRTDLHPLAYFSAVPRAGLPAMDLLVSNLKERIPTATAAELEDLPVNLEQNYRLMVTGGDKRTSGFVLRLGRAEVLFTIRPDNATVVSSSLAENPDSAAPSGTEANAAMFNTGSFSNATTVNKSPLSGSVSLGVQLGAVTAGMSVSATRNAQHHTMTTAHFVENGQVSNHRTRQTLLAVDMNLSYRVRVDGDDTDWADLRPILLHDHAKTSGRSGAEADEQADVKRELGLWIPDRFLADPHAEMATDTRVSRPFVPERYAALGLTGLPDLFDVAVRGLRARWSDKDAGRYLRSGGGVREHLRSGLDNLVTNLRKSQTGRRLAEQSRGGYAVYLHEPGSDLTIATVRVHTRILNDTEASAAGLQPLTMFGETPDSGANIEEVHTLLNASGASNSVGQAAAAGASVAGGPAAPLSLLRLSTTVGVSTSQESSASYDGLKVTVSRWAGPTSFYAVPMELSLQIEVRHPRADGRGALREEDLRTFGTASLTLADAEAYNSGFPVEASSLEAIRLRASRKPPTGKERRSLPRHMRKTVGLSHVRIEQATVDAIGEHIRSALSPQGYFPARTNDYADVTAFSYAETTEAKILNDRALENWLLGIGDHFNNSMTEEGNQLRLTRKPGLGPTGAPWTEAFATVNLRTRFSLDEAEDLGPAPHERLAVLLMALRIAGQSRSGSKSLSAGLNVGFSTEILKSAGFNISGSLTAGSSRGEVQVFNHPILFEPPGDPRRYRIGRLQIDVVISESNQGLVPGHRVGGDRQLSRKSFAGTAELLVPDLSTDFDPEQLSKKTWDAAPEVLERSVIYSLNTSGVTDKLLGLLPADLRGAASPVEDAIRQATAHHTIMSQAPHMIQGRGHFDLDNGVAYGLLSNAYTVLAGAITVKEAMFLGASADPVVLGQISLLQNEMSSGQSTGRQLAVGTAGASLGDAKRTGMFGADMSLGWGASRSHALVGGFESIALAVGTVYVYGANTSFALGAHWHKNALFVSIDKGSSPPTSVDDREMVFMIPQQDALRFYLKGALPVPKEQLAQVVRLWRDGELARLKLGSTLMARLLLHWKKKETENPAGDDLPTLAARVREQHEQGGVRVVDAEVWEQFNAAFPQHALSPVTLHLPRYLANPYEPHRRIGPASVDTVRFDDGATLWGKIQEWVNKAAPGLLSVSPLLEVSEGGQLLGKVHAGRMTAETLFSNLSKILYMDMVGGEVELQFVNTWGPLHETVSIILSAELTGRLKPVEERLDGMQFYLHGQNSRTVTSDRSMKLIGTARVIDSDTEVTAAPSEALSLGTDSQVGFTRKQYWESRFDYNKTVDLEAGLQITAEVRLGNLPGADLNNLAMGLQRRATGRSSSAYHLDGTMRLSLSSSLLSVEEPFTYQLPSSIPVEFPLNAHPVGFVVTSGYHRQIRTLLRAAFGNVAVEAGARPDTFLPKMMANSLLTAQAVRERSEGTELTDSLALPSSPLRRALVAKRVKYTDLRLLKVFNDAGFGTYFKHITSVNTSRRTTYGAAFELGLSHGWDISRPGIASDVPGSVDASSASQVQPRTESFVKEEKPVYLVAAAGSITLRMAVTQSHITPGVRPRPLGLFRSQKISGESYWLVNEDTYFAMQAAVEKARTEQVGKPHAWEDNPKTIQEFDLAQELLEVARHPWTTAEVAPTLVARAIGDRMDHGLAGIKGGPALLRRVRGNARSLITDVRRIVLDFDADRIERETGIRPVTHFQEPEKGVLRPDQPVLGANVVHLVSRVAVELDSYVELRIRERRHQRTWRFHPQGRIFAFDPKDRVDGSPLSTESAVDAGVLTPEVARLADLWGVDADQLGRLESTSYSRDLTLDRAVRADIAALHAHFTMGHPSLADALEHSETVRRALEVPHAEEYRSAADEIRDIRRRTEANVKQIYEFASGRDRRLPSDDDAARIRGEALTDRSWLEERGLWRPTVAAFASHSGDSPSPAPAAYASESGGDRASVERRGPLLAPPTGVAAPYLPADLLTYRFGERRHVLGEKEAYKAHKLAARLRSLIRERKERGLSSLVVTVTAGGNGSRLPVNGRASRADKTGQDRAVALRDYLLAQLGRLASEEITFKTASRGLRLPHPAGTDDVGRRLERRRAVVDVESASVDDGLSAPGSIVPVPERDVPVPGLDLHEVSPQIGYGVPPRMWSAVSGIERSATGGAGVFFLSDHSGNSVVVKPMPTSAPEVFYADNFIRTVGRVATPRSMVYESDSPDGRALYDILSTVSIQKERGAGELSQQIAKARHYAVMERVDGEKLSDIARDWERLHGLLGDSNAMRDVGRLVVLDSFLGATDRLIFRDHSENLQCNIMYSKEGGLVAIDNEFLPAGGNDYVLKSPNLYYLRVMEDKKEVDRLASKPLSYLEEVFRKANGISPDQRLGKLGAALEEAHSQVKHGIYAALSEVGSRALEQETELVREQKAHFPDHPANYWRIGSLASYADSRFAGIDGTRGVPSLSHDDAVVELLGLQPRSGGSQQRTFLDREERWPARVAGAQTLPGEASSVNAENLHTGIEIIDRGQQLTPYKNPEDLRAQFSEEVQPAVRAWGRETNDRSGVLERILGTPGSRSLVFGTRPGGPVWAINVGGTITWFGQDAELIETPQLTRDPIVSIDMDPLGRLVGPAAEAARATAHNATRTEFCELNLGADLTAVLGQWPEVATVLSQRD